MKTPLRLLKGLSASALWLSFLAFPLATSKAGVKGAYEVFDAVWHQVNIAYYDPTFGGKDWIEIGERYRARLDNLDSVSDLRILLTRMLSELGESHFAIVPGSYDSSSPQRWSGGELGMRTAIVGKKAVIVSVDTEGPAWDAGIRPGYLIERIGKVSVDKLLKETVETGLPDHLTKVFWHDAIESHLGVRPRETVQLRLKTGSVSTKKIAVTGEPYTGRMSEPFGYVPALPLEFEGRVGEDGIAYMRFNLWFPAIMGDIRSFVTSLNGDVKGLVIDVRGNAGGIGLMATGVSGLISEEEFTLGRMSMRQGFVNLIAYPQPKAYLGPVAVLIDGLSLSTTEIFAGGMKETGRARLFGEATGGAVLPSGFIDLPNGDKLQMAFANYTTEKGVRLEGVGVGPDVEVKLEPKLLRRGIDSVLEAAKDWIREQN